MFLKNFINFLFSNRKNIDFNPIRKDVHRIDIQEYVYFNVYWKVLKIGKGPAATLNIHNKEILKFDCFGKDDGHFHVSPNYNKRIFFEENSAREQINRTSSELKNNLNKYLDMNNDKKVGEIEINNNNLELAVDEMQEKMIRFLETVPEIRGI